MRTRMRRFRCLKVVVRLRYSTTGEYACLLHFGLCHYDPTGICASLFGSIKQTEEMAVYTF